MACIGVCLNANASTHATHRHTHAFVVHLEGHFARDIEAPPVHKVLQQARASDLCMGWHNHTHRKRRQAGRHAGAQCATYQEHGDEDHQVAIEAGHRQQLRCVSDLSE